MVEAGRYPWRDVAWLFGAALIARALAALLVSAPPYTDAAYYTLVAERLAGGHGFSVPVIWSFLEVGGRLPADPSLPVPSNGHWWPLTSILAAGFMALLDDGWRAGQVPMVLLGALLAPITHLVAWEVWKSRRPAMLAGLLAIFAGPLLIMYPLVDSFAPFGVAGSLALYAALRAASPTATRPAAWLVLSGALVGAATLVHVNGVMLAVAPAIAWWQRRAPLAAGLGSALAFLLVVAPWLARNVAVYGAPLPSVGGHTLWITSYNEQFSIGHEVSLATYLAAGPGLIIGSKLGAAVELAGRALSVSGGIFAIFAVGGAVLLWRRAEVRPLIGFWLAMFAAMALLFTFHAPKGAFMHAAPAWLPFAYAIAAGSVAPVSTALGRYWPFLRRPATHRFIEVAGLLGAVILSLAASATLLVGWRSASDRLAPAVAFLEQRASRSEVVMYADPARLNLLTGNPAVPPPFDPYPVVEDVVDAYGVRWVVVTLEGAEARDPLGLWDGAAAVDSEGNHPSFLSADPAFEAPGVRVFEVIPHRD